MHKETMVVGVLILLWAGTISAQGPDTLWTRTYGGGDEDYGSSVQETSDGGYIVVGSTYSFGVGGQDVYLIKTNQDGDTLWTRTYGGALSDNGRSVQETLDGGYIIAGFTTSFGAGGYDVYLIRTDADGDTLWTRTYGGTSSDFCGSVRQTSDSGYIHAGRTESFGMGNEDVYLIRTDADGDTFWTRTYGGTEDDGGVSVQQTSDGGFVVIGWTESFGAGEEDVYLLKTDEDGDTLWTRTYGGSSLECGYSVQETYGGGYAIAGYTFSFGAGGGDFWLIRTDEDGDTVWTRTYGEGRKSDVCYSGQQTLDGGYVMAGHRGEWVGFDIYLVKTNPVKLVSPNGGEELIGDSVCTIMWWNENPMINSYRLLLSTDWGSSYGDTIADGVSEDSTSWEWVVPPSYSGSCRVKVEVLDVADNVICEDVSDSSFVIGPIGIAENSAEMRDRFAIFGSYPNPFSPQTNIRYTLPEEANVSLRIHNSLGQEIRRLTDEFQQAGAYTVVWDATDNSGRKVPSGTYFLRLEAHTPRSVWTGLTTGSYTATRKLCVVR